MPRYPSTVMVTVVCPWDDHERLAEDVFRREIRDAVAKGFRRIYVFGTAGEGYAVDTERFTRVLEVFGDELLGTETTPMVGVIGLSTGNVLERLRIARDLGFRDFQISLPSWSALSDAEVLQYFVEIAGTFPDSSFMHYNTVRSRRVLTGTEYRWLSEAVPNLVATKIISSDLKVVSSAVRDAPELMHFLAETTIAHGSLYGQCALLGTYGILAPKRSWALLEAVQAGRFREAAEIGSWFDSVSRDVLEPLFADVRVDGAYDKVIAKLGGVEDLPLRMLSPYRTVSDDEFERTRQLLRELHPECE
ncbi:MAG TPA: dihydrodipicolinate synthase family protein [Candidatus Saccharimonadales bacterium]|nr:dihydrodipicolinate synthase family protein [Candidatus Saccharimonadales bacterium]